LTSIGNYHLSGHTLGEGTFARVELAKHVLLDAEVALKITIKSEIDADGYQRKHLHREASLLGSLAHPNVVRLFEICNSANIYCLALEYVSGGTLFDRVKDRGHLHEDEARHWTGQLASAVAYLHRQRVLHRDLKLENALLAESRLVLIDLGLSNAWYPGKVMQTHCGTAEYASPELFVKGPYTATADVWSFGVMLYTMVIGHLPFQIGEGKEAGRASNLPRLVQKIRRGLCKDHFVEMRKLSIGLQALLIQCLTVNHARRINAQDVLKQSWLSEDADRLPEKAFAMTSPEAGVVVEELRRRLKLKTPFEKIRRHVESKAFGTTGGCFNILHAQQTTYRLPNVPNEPDQATVEENLLEQHTTIPEEDIPTSYNEPMESKMKSASQRQTLPLIWTRSFSSSGESAKPRLKRVEVAGKEEEMARSSLLRLGQRALEDISNTIRPLLRGKQRCSSDHGLDDENMRRGWPPPHIPHSVKATPKLKKNDEPERKLKVARKPLR